MTDFSRNIRILDELRKELSSCSVANKKYLASDTRATRSLKALATQRDSMVELKSKLSGLYFCLAINNFDGEDASEVAAIRDKAEELLVSVDMQVATTEKRIRQLAADRYRLPDRRFALAKIEQVDYDNAYATVARASAGSDKLSPAFCLPLKDSQVKVWVTLHAVALAKGNTPPISGWYATEANKLTRTVRDEIAAMYQDT